jgi:hypothetical protein
VEKIRQFKNSISLCEMRHKGIIKFGFDFSTPTVDVLYHQPIKLKDQEK